MNQIKENFLKNTKIRDSKGRLEGVEQVFDFLTEPENLYKMILASNFQLPALTFVAEELEKRFGDTSLFPVVKTFSSERATERQNIGRIVKIIMIGMGYTVLNSEIASQSRIPFWAKTNSFTTCAVYKRDISLNPRHTIEINLH